MMALTLGLHYLLMLDNDREIVDDAQLDDDIELNNDAKLVDGLLKKGIDLDDGLDRRSRQGPRSRAQWGP